MINTNRPHLIVLTPVRNEAWVLRAFLSATSLWADKIIIADQMSTDGSREIYKEFCKVKVIDNTNPDMHMAATRRLLHREAQKIEGEKIIFALDADEFLSGDFMHTEAWKTILNSCPNDVFCWRWMNLKIGDITQYSTFRPYYWAAHESLELWDGKFPDNFIHEWRLPWPSNAHEHIIDDFCSIHLARVNQLRQKNKERFYQVSSLAEKNTQWNVLSIYRMYHREEHLTYIDVPKDAYSFYKSQGVDLWSFVDMSDEGEHYTSEILRYFRRDGLRKYALLDIWDSDWCKRHHIQNPQHWYHHLVMHYFRWSNNHLTNFAIRGIDKVLKWLYK